MNDIPIEMKKIISRILQVPAEKITAESSPKTIQTWDSLRHVELVIEIENQYGLSFSPTEVFSLTSVQGICDMLARRNLPLGGTANERN